jgi:hypothetical protein
MLWDAEARIVHDDMISYNDHEEEKSVWVR